MKTIGFIKEHEEDNFNQLKAFKDYTFLINPYKKQILKYLKSGIPVGVKMNIVQSLYPNDNMIIGGLTYLTDGHWIWTNYLIYYLEKYDIEIQKEFTEYFLNNTIQMENSLKKKNAINYLKNMNFMK